MVNRNYMKKPDYSYQQNLISLCYQHLKDNRKTVLAASCGAGKTRISIEIILKYIRDFPEKRVLILPHGQTLLRTQYYSVIKDYFPQDSLYVIHRNSTDDENIIKKKVVISLPQTISNKNNLDIGAFGLVVIDEAHNFYLVDDGMVKEILSSIRHQCELLLTGSPSKFIAENAIKKENEYEIVSISSSDLLNKKVIIDPKIFLMKTKQYSFNLGDYFSKNEIRKRKIDLNLTKNLIHEVVKCIDGLNNKKSNRNKIKPSLNAIKKMMVVSLDEQHATEITEILREMGLNTLLSTYSFDENSKEIENFKTDSSIQVLVVVQRGILGFNYPDLQCVIDISLSLNPDRIFQMINRVVRISKDKNKFFIKVMPEELIEIAEVALSCACALSVKQIYEKYSGNYKDIPIPIMTPHAFEYPPQEDGDKKVYRLPGITYIPSFEVMTKLQENQNKKLSGYCWTTFNSTRDKLLLKPHYWTLEKCKEISSQFNRSGEWSKNHYTSYSAAIYHGWLQECTAHMESKQLWTKESCKEIALRYRRPADWIKGHKSSYQAALTHKWLAECSAHMTKALFNYWTLEKCKEEALKYNRPSEWIKNSVNSYNAAKRNGWLKECSSHMTKALFNYWTLDKCKEEAKKYNRPIDWDKNSRSSYGAARKNGWLKECTAHMETKNHWTKESCKEIALGYNRPIDWQNNHRKSYNSAANHLWLKECTAHMTPKNWTLERCKEEALKYKRSIDWANNNKSSYNAACKNKWINECTAHMEKIQIVWTLEKCLEIALQFMSSSQWIKNNKASYKAAYKRGWLKECTAHMRKLRTKK